MGYTMKSYVQILKTRLILAFEKANEFLKSERGNATAEAALIVMGVGINYLWPNPLIGPVVEIVLFWLSKLKDE